MATFRLQPLASISGNKTQDKADAVDVEPFKSLVIQVIKPVFGIGTLYIQHSATLDDFAFANTGTSFDLNTAENEVKVLSDPLKYLRWNALWTSGTPKFQIDVVARKA